MGNPLINGLNVYYPFFGGVTMNLIFPSMAIVESALFRTVTMPSFLMC